VGLHQGCVFLDVHDTIGNLRGDLTLIGGIPCGMCFPGLDTIGNLRWDPNFNWNWYVPLSQVGCHLGHTQDWWDPTLYFYLGSTIMQVIQGQSAAQMPHMKNGFPILRRRIPMMKIKNTEDSRSNWLKDNEQSSNNSKSIVFDSCFRFAQIVVML